MKQVQALRERLGNQGRLIVSTLSLALAVERHWHDDIGCKLVALACH